MKLIAPDPEVRIRLPYEYTAKALLTETEKRFYDCLAKITDARCRIQVNAAAGGCVSARKNQRCLPDDQPEACRFLDLPE